jgi:NAD(P)-dependent dehydrogenase (short-subunit alcohol dehydrogenase family)
MAPTFAQRRQIVVLAVALALERFGKLDILVNNAATIKYTRVLDLTLEEWDSILSVNLTGAFLHSREAVRAMTPKKSGAIVIQLGTTDDCGFSPFGDDLSTARETAFAKIRARVEGTQLAVEQLG